MQGVPELARCLFKGYIVSVTIHLHKNHHRYANGDETVSVDGKTVHECFNRLIKAYPDLKKVIFTEKGKLHPLIEVYINSKSAYPDALCKEVNDGDKIHLVYTLAGG